MIKIWHIESFTSFTRLVCYVVCKDSSNFCSDIEKHMHLSGIGVRKLCYGMDQSSYLPFRLFGSRICVRIDLDQVHVGTFDIAEEG